MTQDATGPEIGDKMPDDTVYAAVSPDAGGPIYMAPLTDSLTQQWKAARKLNKNHAHGHQGLAAATEAARLSAELSRSTAIAPWIALF